MPQLFIQLTKRADGGAVLRCARADGSVTWQRQHGPRASFFPLHDLAHYAVETELKFRDGFYGLIAQGWDIDETTGKTARGPPPSEAVVVEHLVGLLDLERTTGVAWTAAEVNAHAAEYFRTANRPGPRALGDEDLNRVRDAARALYEKWRALPAGATLELHFDGDPR
jgi:hypothetical protein